MKSHIAYGIKFICYSGTDDAGEVTGNIVGDHNINQFLQNFGFFEKTMANFLHIFMFIKSIYFLQETRLRHSTNKTDPSSASAQSLNMLCDTNIQGFEYAKDAEGSEYA